MKKTLVLLIIIILLSAVLASCVGWDPVADGVKSAKATVSAQQQITPDVIQCLTPGCNLTSEDVIK